MRIALRRTIKIDKVKFRQHVIKQVLPKLEAIILASLTEFMNALESSMGSSAAKYNWAPLDDNDNDNDNKFWFDTGQLRSDLVVMFDVTETGVKFFAGLSTASSEYEKAVWNEYGFATGTGIIRRPLFTPLSDEQLSKLRQKLTEVLKPIKYTVRTK